MTPLFPLIIKWKTTAALLALVAVAWCFWQWQPGRQVQLHQNHFLEAAQDRDFQKLKAMLDDGFHTSGGHDKTSTLQLAAEVLRQFFALEITGSETRIVQAPSGAEVTTRLRIGGRGLPAADAVQEVVNGSTEPFVFTWQRKSWKPWDWRLVYVSHSLITRAAASDWPY